MNWSSLIFGSYSHAEIAAAVSDPVWQSIRVSLLYTPLETKYAALQEYIGGAPDPVRRIQVTNYVNALKRGGLINAQ
jgi:hypothetical protein